MKAADPPAVVYRLGRRPEPWAWPDWAYAKPDGTFGNRFDDPMSGYRVLYASTQRLATFLECLAYYRPDQNVADGYAAIQGEPGDVEPIPLGRLPAAWLDQRCVGSGRLVGTYVDLGHHETLVELRAALLTRIVHHGLRELDAATIRLSAPRAFTQEISRYVFDRSTGGTRRWNGIAYRSKHGDDFENSAIFEPATPVDVATSALEVDDPDLQSALALLGLELAR